MTRRQACLAPCVLAVALACALGAIATINLRTSLLLFGAACCFFVCALVLADSTEGEGLDG